MLNSVLEMYVPAVLIILILIINALTSMSAPIDQNNMDESNKDETNEHDPASNDADTDTSDLVPCWQTENFEPVGPCAPCHPFASKVLTDSCHETGFNQLVHCAESDQKVYKSCPKSRATVEKSFWIFEGVTLSIGFVSCTVVFFRRRKLNREAAERVRKQISNSA